MTTPRHLLAYTLLALGLTSITVGALARADVYKWTDAKGNVHYEDRNSGNVDTIKLSPKVPPPDPSSAIVVPFTFAPGCNCATGIFTSGVQV